MEIKIRGSIIFLRRDSLRNILSSVYGNKESVDEDLIDVGALSSHSPLFLLGLMMYSNHV